VSKAAGVDDPTSKSLGVAVLDFDVDGWPDLFVANDTQPNKLYRNNRQRHLHGKGLRAGVAYSEEGIARGAMGVDAADYDRSGRPHLLVGNFSNQMLGLYHNEGNGLFVDDAPRSTVGRERFCTLAFGVFFFDYDLDGWLDILAANGHIEEEIGRVQPKVQYRQPPLLFRNLGKGRFEHVTSLGADFNAAHRGAGRGVCRLRPRWRPGRRLHHQPRPRLPVPERRRQSPPLDRRPTRGTKSNRDGIGAVVRVTRGGSSSGRWCGAARATLAERPDADLRPGRQPGRGDPGGGVAQRRA
jgi:enediyne biosynthesis protein E4